MFWNFYVRFIAIGPHDLVEGALADLHDGRRLVRLDMRDPLDLLRTSPKRDIRTSVEKSVRTSLERSVRTSVEKSV